MIETDVIFNFINILKNLNNPDINERNKAEQIIKNLEKNDDYWDKLFELFNHEHLENFLKKNILILIKDHYLNRSNDENIELIMSKIFNFIYSISKDQNIEYELIKINFNNLKKILNDNNYKNNELKDKIIFELKNTLNKEFKLFLVSDQGYLIFFNYLIFLLKNNNFRYNDNSNFLNEIIFYIRLIIRDYISIYIDESNNLAINNFLMKSIKKLLKMLNEWVKKYSISEKRLLLKLLKDQEFINFKLKLISFINKNNLYDNFSLILKYFKKVYIFIDKKIKNKNILNNLQIKENNNFKTSLQKIINELLKNIYNNMLFIINDQNFDLINEGNNIVESQYYNYFNNSLKFFNFFIEMNEHFEYFLFINKDLLINILINLIVISNNNNDLENNLEKDFIKRHLNLLNNFNENQKNKLIFKILKFIEKIITIVDSGLNLIYNIAKFGLINSLKLDNFIKNNNDKDKLNEVINLINKSKWFLNIDEYQKLEIYILWLIYINSYMDNEQNEFEFIIEFINSCKEKILNSNNIPLILKFIYLIALYQDKIVVNKNMENEYLTFIFKLIYLNNNLLINTFIIRLLFKMIKNNLDKNKIILKKFIYYGVNIINIIEKDYKMEYFEILKIVFIKNFRIFEIEISYNYKEIFDKINNIIIKNIMKNLYLSQNNLTLTELNKYFDCLIVLTKNKGYCSLYSNILYEFLFKINNLIDFDKNYIWTHTYFDLINIFVENNYDKNNLMDLFYFLINIYEKHNKYSIIILIIIKFFSNNNFQKNENIFKELESFLEQIMNNLDLKEIELTELKYFIYYLIIFVFKYKEYFSIEIIDVIYKFLFNYFNLINDYYDNNENNLEQNLEGLLISNEEISCLLFLSILFLNCYFINYEVILLNYGSKFIIIYNILINNLEMKKINIRITKIILISLIFIMNSEFLNNKPDLKNQLVEFLICNLLANYYKLELEEIDKDIQSLKINKLESNIILDINNIYKLIGNNKNDFFSYHLDTEDIKPKFLNNKEDNLLLDYILENINEYDLFNEWFKNSNVDINNFRLKNEVNILLNVKVFKCEYCKKIKTRIIYDKN